jgi:NhaP-type Na+/H+ or K+/H+ antiporter
MMLIVALGSIGLGLVWGWLIGNLQEQARKPWRTILTVGGATLAFAAEVLLLAGGVMVVLFMAATGLALMLHLGWRQDLHNRFIGPK